MIPLLGRLLGFVAGSLLRIRRRLVEDAMARAGIADPSRQARAMYASLGRGVFELLWLAIAPRARREAFLESVVLDATPDGPCVLAASHTGNWEAAAAAAARTRRVAMVAKPFSWRAFDAFCTYLRKRLGVEVIRPDGAMAAARAVLRAGGSIAMPVDQVPNRAAHGVPVEFLGAPVLVDRAPFVVAKRAGVPLLVIAASGSHRVEVLRRIDVDDVAEAAREATAALEAFVRRHPASWMWLHRRWRAPRDRVGTRPWTTRSSSQDAVSRAA